VGLHDEHRELAREPRPIRGLRTPLFDRLQESGPDTPSRGDSARVLDITALLESVRNDVARLLNTRAHLRGRSAELAAGTVMDYGLPDFSFRSAKSGSDMDELAAEMTRRLSASEPRLAAVRVVLQMDPGNPQRITGTIFASLRTGMQMEPVTFPVQIASAAGIGVSSPMEGA
jgi:type VI secretion system lysozyme-like protein